MPLPSTVVAPVAEYQDQVAALELAALGAFAATRYPPSNADAWRNAVAAAGTLLLSFQVSAAALADQYVARVLIAQGAALPAAGVVNAAAFADLVDGGGSLLAALVFAPTATYRDHAGQLGAAAARARWVAQSMVRTAIHDTARAAVHTSMWAHDVPWYVRGLRPPSCSRCVVLAGRRYRCATAFRRHKRCDCVHVPAANDPDDWTTDSRAYFRGLSEQERVATFGAAGAQAISMGADVGQVVNAESGVEIVQGLATTRTGTTARGLAGQRLGGSSRLMPEEIFSMADRLGWSTEQVLEQLRRYAYVV